MKQRNNKSSQNKTMVQLRKQYMKQSQLFVDWVDSLGFEKTFLGQFLEKLDRKYNLRSVLILFLFCLFLSFFMFTDFDFSYDLSVGSVAPADIKSPISFQIVDEVSTEEKRVEAEKNTLAVFDYDPEAFEAVYGRIYVAFKKMREQIKKKSWSKSLSRREEEINDFVKYKPEFQQLLNLEISHREFEWLVENRFSVSLENVIIRLLSSWSNLKISESLKKTININAQQVILRNLEGGSPGKDQPVQLSEVLDLHKLSSFPVSEIRGFTRFDKNSQRRLVRLAHSLLVPNVTFNKQETARRRVEARNSVLPIQVSIAKNQIIVGSGQKIQPIHVSLFNEIKTIKSQKRTDLVALLSALLFCAFILVSMSYLRRFTLKKVRINQKDIIVMGTVTLVIVGFTKFFLYIMGIAFETQLFHFIPEEALLFAAPIAAGPMLVGLLISYGEVVWLFTLFLGLVLSLMVDRNFPFLIMSIIGGIAAARGVFACEKRNDIYFAGLRTGVINALVVFLIMYLKNISSENLGALLAGPIVAGFLGGIFSSFLTMMFIPLLESIFNYTTDVKLLELSSLNHPLMKEMMVKAPGTYHHCLSVGTMVDEAARSIEANPLLAKVMAYYHDIGKSEHAQYFAENQRPGHNPHDQITPYMSKTILIAHVKDGAELGLRYKLGKPIIDGILQHHGTTLISYFYNKALKESENDNSSVEESDFRYPGPKPQFKEAALVMLADSIEAAARCIEEPTAARLTHLVKNIIQSKFIDGQLNECNLSLRDLSTIEKAFKKTILNIYHQRIDYPHMSLGAPVKDKKSKKQSLSAVNNG